VCGFLSQRTEISRNPSLVCRDNCLDNRSPSLGDGWNLDSKIRVRNVHCLVLANSKPRLLFIVFITFGNFGTSRSLNKKSMFSQLYVRLYNIGFGMFQAPLYALLQTMMAELSPPGFDYVVCLSRSIITA
jgi:hypothetical protein